MTKKTNWKAIDAKLITRAWEDEAFKATLYKNPQRALEQAGLSVPEGIEIKVVEERPGLQMQDTPAIHYLIIPAKPGLDAGDEFELSNEELEAVAGGSSGPEKKSTTTTYKNKEECGC